MKVTVWMTAYNHEKYIRQCLDSVLSQKTDFEFDIVLGEDVSTDDTRKIVLEYAEKNPGKFKLFLPEKNTGMMNMDVATLKLCEGEYLALMNGDDYWIDENKLQTQADFLDRNPDTVLCYHRARVDNENDGTSFETVYLEKDEVLPAESLLQGYNPIMTATVMMRNVFKMPDWYSVLPYGDMPMYLMLSQTGKIKYIDKLMGVYRIHSNGDWQGDSVKNNLLKDLKFYEFMNEKLDHKYDHLIKKIFAQRYFDIVISSINRNEIGEARDSYEKLLSSDKEFLENNKEDLGKIREILYEEKDLSVYKDLLNKSVKWKVS